LGSLCNTRESLGRRFAYQFRHLIEMDEKLRAFD
jgi:hypothetical protein